MCMGWIYCIVTYTKRKMAKVYSARCQVCFNVYFHYFQWHIKVLAYHVKKHLRDYFYCCFFPLSYASVFSPGTGQSKTSVTNNVACCVNRALFINASKMHYGRKSYKGKRLDIDNDKLTNSDTPGTSHF